MRLQDALVKAIGPDLWLFQTTGSYRVRLDRVALETLEGLLAKAIPCELSENEAFIFARLTSRGMIAGDPDPGSSPPIRILGRSRLKTLDLELSSRCNLQCGHCFAAMDGRTTMERAILERVLGGVTDLEPVNLVLGGGEPLLSPLWRYAVEEARRCDLRVVVMTNGTLITADAAAFLGQARVAKVCVSLDGFEASHDALRGRRAFARTVAAIRRLVANEVPVFVTTMLSDETLARQEEFQSFCLDDLGVAGIRLSTVVPVGKGATAPATFQVADGVLRRTFGSGDAEDDLEPPPATASENAWPCEAGVEQCFIAADGQVYACHYFQNLREPLGDLRRAPLADIYHAGLAGPVAARMRWRDLPGCRDCPALAACRGGCRARAKLLAGSLAAPDPYSCRIHR